MVGEGVGFVVAGLGFVVVEELGLVVGVDVTGGNVVVVVDVVVVVVVVVGVDVVVVVGVVVVVVEVVVVVGVVVVCNLVVVGVVALTVVVVVAFVVVLGDLVDDAVLLEWLPALPSIATSEQPKNSSWGPHPTQPFPLGSTPQLFPGY